jgi:hypothetical protein
MCAQVTMPETLHSGLINIAAQRDRGANLRSFKFAVQRLYKAPRVIYRVNCLCCTPPHTTDADRSLLQPSPGRPEVISEASVSSFSVCILLRYHAPTSSCRLSAIIVTLYYEYGYSGPVVLQVGLVVVLGVAVYVDGLFIISLSGPPLSHAVLDSERRYR